MHASLAERIALGRLDRLGRYVKPFGDLLGVHILTIEFHDLQLASRQSGVELRVAYDARILAFALDRAAYFLESEPASPVYVLFLVKATEVAADKPMAYQVTM